MARIRPAGAFPTLQNLIAVKRFAKPSCFAESQLFDVRARRKSFCSNQIYAVQNEGMTTLAKDLVTMQQAAAITGYSIQTMKRVSAAGIFVKPDRVVGTSHLYDPAKVMAWKRNYVKTRDGRGVPPPPDPKPEPKRKAVRNGH